jgi:hypothetical protein
MVISCNRFTNLLFFFLSKWNVKKGEKEKEKRRISLAGLGVSTVENN